MAILFPVLGYSGAALVLGAYVAVSTRHTAAKTIRFQLANVVGSALLMVYLWHMHAIPNVILNAIWLVVGIVAIKRILSK